MSHHRPSRVAIGLSNHQSRTRLASGRASFPRPCRYRASCSSTTSGASIAKHAGWKSSALRLPEPLDEIDARPALTADKGKKNEKTCTSPTGLATRPRSYLRPGAGRRLAQPQCSHRVPVHPRRLAGQYRPPSRQRSSARNSARPSSSRTAPAPAARSPPTMSPSRHPMVIRFCWATSAATRWCRTSIAKPAYNAVTDLETVAWIGTQPNLLCCNPSFPHDTLPKLIAAAKAEPGKYAFGSSGLGTSPTLTMELFKQKTGCDITFISYRGACGGRGRRAGRPRADGDFQHRSADEPGQCRQAEADGIERRQALAGHAQHADLRRDRVAGPRRDLVVDLGGADRHAGQDQGQVAPGDGEGAEVAPTSSRA